MKYIRCEHDKDPLECRTCFPNTPTPQPELSKCCGAEKMPCASVHTKPYCEPEFRFHCGKCNRPFTPQKEEGKCCEKCFMNNSSWTEESRSLIFRCQNPNCLCHTPKQEKCEKTEPHGTSNTTCSSLCDCPHHKQLEPVKEEEKVIMKRIECEGVGDNNGFYEMTFAPPQATEEQKAINCYEHCKLARQDAFKEVLGLIEVLSTLEDDKDNPTGWKETCEIIAKRITSLSQKSHE